jgi:hypothetical protein
MAYTTRWLPLLLGIFILRKPDVASEQISELTGGTASKSGLRREKNLLAAMCYVSGYYIVHVSSL